MQVVRKRLSVMADKSVSWQTNNMYGAVKFHYRFVKFLYKKINDARM